MKGNFDDANVNVLVTSTLEEVEKIHINSFRTNW